MHAVFVSQCTKKAILKTARVLDAYALRRGDRTWMTPITLEGLQAVRAQLRAVASRNTAVACYLNQGRDTMRLAWVVGARSQFGLHGEVPVGSTASSRPYSHASLSAGIRAACLLAKASGYAHDFGKFGVMFQKKLAGKGPMKDAVRHEWLSLHLLLEDVLARGWDAAWKESLNRFKDLSAQVSLSSGLQSARAAFLYLVFTHHRLPGDENVKGNSLPECLTDGTYVERDGEKHADLKPAAAPSPSTINTVRALLKRMETHTQDDPLYWRAVASVARMALILADHSVSSVNKLGAVGHGADAVATPGVAFANTVTDPRGRRVLNQELNWHLQNVGEEAALMLPRMLAFNPPGLSEPVLQLLRKPTEGRFAWQGQGAEALKVAQAQQKMPTLVFNIAGTGSGKTRMNVLCVAALREGEPVRFATGLNLRTLTLQTRDAYAQQLGMGDDELACVLGSAIAIRLHDAQHKPAAGKPSPALQEDEDGNLPEELFDATGDSDPAPEWLEHFLAKSPRMRPLVMSPAVVATADFLVKAGDLNEKANHALTMLRLMKSDLILDEIDSYDPKALVAVMRLVTAAVMWGRHVIASSATLSAPVARALWQAFDLGMKMGAALGVVEQPQWRQVLMDDRQPVSLASHVVETDFVDWYGQCLADRCATMPRLSLRPMELVDVPLSRNKPEEVMVQALVSACQTMHGRHRWEIMVDGQSHQVSLGLVRIANITPAVTIASALARALPHARVACYHAQMSRMHRHLLEADLDRILRRHPGTDTTAQLLATLSVRDAIEQSMNEGRTETSFIVVATPVEEVGRDHDFDWAVIEPSSTQSIVQTAGRVNRHRLEVVHEPNVAVLRRNLVEIRDGRRGCFLRPGLEDAGALYGSHDLEQLINWAAIEEAGQVDARLRYQTQSHRFAAEDDRSLEKQVGKWSSTFLRSDTDLWMGANTYKAVSLRERTPKETWTRDEAGAHYREQPINDDWRQREFARAHMNEEKGPTNAWLTWPVDVLVDRAREIGIDVVQGLAAEVRAPAEDSPRKLMFNRAYGYYLPL